MRATTEMPVRERSSGPRLPDLSFRLSLLVAALALVVAGVGVLLAGQADPTPFTTARGETVELYGQGLYRYDTVFAAANNRSTDLVTLTIGLPLLAATAWEARRGSLRARVLLLGALGYFLYIGASYALGAVTYNDLFLVYVALFSAALFAFVSAIASFREIDPRVASMLPRRPAAVFMLASGIATLGIWIMDPVAALIGGAPPPGLAASSTLFTHALDIGAIVPAAVTAGVMILRRRPLGYVVAFSLLVLEAMLMPIITIATILQVRMGISFTAAEVAGPIVGFTILAAAAIWVLATMLRRLPPAILR